MRLVIYLVNNYTTVRFGSLNLVEHLFKNANVKVRFFTICLSIGEIFF